MRICHARQLFDEQIVLIYREIRKGMGVVIIGSEMWLLMVLITVRLSFIGIRERGCSSQWK